MTITLDPTLVAFVKKEEGFAAVAFWDYRQWTNGYGTKAHFARETISQTEAERRLEIELSAAQAIVEQFAPDAPQGVKNALADLTYNAGAGWAHQGLGEEIKAGNWAQAKVHLEEYDRAGGKVNAGLESRRKVEASWFPEA